MSVTESSPVGLINPHGGSLVNRLVPAIEASSLKEKAKDFPQIPISERT